MMLVARPGYRIDSRTIKRGSRPSILIVSFVESSNLYILGIIFIGSYLALIVVWFWCLSCLSWQVQVHQRRLSYGSPIVFLVLEVYRFVSFREVLSFPIWFYPPLLDYDVYLYILVELVVTFLTSPRSSKTESRCERYARFHFASSAVFQRGGSSGS